MTSLRTAWPEPGTTAPLLVPGCHDPLSVRVAADAGAGAVFLSGSGVGRGLFGTPHVPAEHAETYFGYLGLVAAAAPVPLIADAEAGFADPVRTIERCARAGVAAVVISDTHRDGTRTAPGRMRAMIDAGLDAGVAVIPRADGLDADRDECLSRAAGYVDGGADLVLVLLDSVLDRTRDTYLRTVELAAGRLPGHLVAHSRHGTEFAHTRDLPPGIRVFIASRLSQVANPTADFIRKGIR